MSSKIKRSLTALANIENGQNRNAGDYAITVFNLIIAHAPINTQSSNLVVFRLQPVYFYLLLYKNICFGNSFDQLASGATLFAKSIIVNRGFSEKPEAEWQTV